MPFDPPRDGEFRHYVACFICEDHQGWAHDDPRHREEPADVCKACLGSGRIYDDEGIDIARAARLAERYAKAAQVALADEHEGNHRAAVLRLGNCADILRKVIARW
jgi:hypothetical protein